MTPIAELLERYGRAGEEDLFDVVQFGSVKLPPALGRSSEDRFDGFNARLVGSGDLLVDDATSWAHLRRKPTPSA